MEAPGIDPGTSRMLSERSTIWATPPCSFRTPVFGLHWLNYRLVGCEPKTFYLTRTHPLADCSARSSDSFPTGLVCYQVHDYFFWVVRPAVLWIGNIFWKKPATSLFKLPEEGGNNFTSIDKIQSDTTINICIDKSLFYVDCLKDMFRPLYRPVWAETRAQSGDRYGSGTLHPGQVLRGSLPLLSPKL